MKSIVCSAALCVSFLFSALPLRAELSERVLTLEESITTGLQNSQSLLSLQEQIGLARQRVSEAGSQIYPKIDFNLSASRFNNTIPTVLAPSFNSIYLPAANKDLYYFTRFSLWQYLYAGGRYTTNLRLAEINLSQAQSQADVERNSIIRDVSRSFYACRVLQEKIRLFEAALRDAKDRAAADTAQRQRWSGFESYLSGELVRLRHEYDKQELVFLDTVGIELNTRADLAGELIPPGEEYDLNKCLAWAFQYRPELRQTQYQETIDSLRVNLSLTERYPTVTLGASYEWAGEKIPLDNTNWNATININVPVFDGWASWARVRQRKYQAREGKIRRAKIEDQIRFDVRQAYMDYSFWKKQIEALVSFPPLQSRDPERSLEGELARLDTLEEALSSKATLDWAIGKPFFK